VESPRRAARELVLQALYASETGASDSGEAGQELLREASLSNHARAFAGELYAKTRLSQSWADEIIASLAANWSIDRLALIDRILLRMALVEIGKMPDTPPKVAINEAIELAKRFSTAKSAAFINGILDSYATGTGSIAKQGDKGVPE